jgi:hypothetical protein
MTHHQPTQPIFSNNSPPPPLRQPEAERRESPRTPYPRSVFYVAMGQLGEGEILNMGDGGIRIRTTLQLLDLGTVFRLLIPFSDPNITVPVFGQVRWVSKEGRTRYEIGLQFLC